MNTVNEGKLLWQPSEERVEQAEITDFIRWANREYDADISDYHSLWRWSVEDVPQFWEAISRRYAVFDDSDYTTVLADSSMPGAQWFSGARLNFAEYTLRQGSENAVAVFSYSESTGERKITWGELRNQVAKLASHMREAGIKPGDHVCAYLPMSCEAVISLMATISIGAIWSSCSPDFGNKSVMERFSQTAPKLLIAISGYRYNGKFCDRNDELKAIVSALDSLEEVIHLPWGEDEDPGGLGLAPNVRFTTWEKMLDNESTYQQFSFEQVPFDHPIWVLYTSGTTGLPKGLVHGHGGVLLEFIKSGYLHDNLDSHSVKFFFTTTGWTMFNLLVGGLVTGSAIMLYDGSPTYPHAGILFELAEKFGVTYFGTSPTFVNGLMAKGYSPARAYDLSKLETIALTGSPSAPETFEWFYDNLHPDLHVMSISGGTDVVTAFVGGAPTLPVYAGEIQSPCLGIDAHAVDEEGREVVGEEGELVISQPMPSMPLYFINDKDNKRYRESYFETFPGMWRQGDMIRFRQDGRCVISGRSDATLNRFGVRVGTSEIYRTVESIEGIVDSLIVNLELPGAQFFMPLFVVLEEGIELNTKLRNEIVSSLKTKCSPRHVPDKIYVVNDIPYTLTGKKQEIPVKKLLSGKMLGEAINPGSCRNLQSLDFFVEFAKTVHEKYKSIGK